MKQYIYIMDSTYNDLYYSLDYYICLFDHFDYVCLSKLTHIIIEKLRNYRVKNVKFLYISLKLLSGRMYKKDISVLFILMFINTYFNDSIV